MTQTRFILQDSDNQLILNAIQNGAKDIIVNRNKYLIRQTPTHDHTLKYSILSSNPLGVSKNAKVYEEIAIVQENFLSGKLEFAPPSAKSYVVKETQWQEQNELKNTKRTNKTILNSLNNEINIGRATGLRSKPLTHEVQPDGKHTAHFRMENPGVITLDEFINNQTAYNHLKGQTTLFYLMHAIMQAYVNDFQMKGFAHRDIKPSNILIDLTHPNYPSVKLIDTGFSTTNTSTFQASGTPCYAAPELYKRPQDSIEIQKTDQFSLGITLGQLWGDKALDVYFFPETVNGKNRVSSLSILQLIRAATLAPNFLNNTTFYFDANYTNQVDKQNLLKVINTLSQYDSYQFSQLKITTNTNPNLKLLLTTLTQIDPNKRFSDMQQALKDCENMLREMECKANMHQRYSIDECYTRAQLLRTKINTITFNGDNQYLQFKKMCKLIKKELENNSALWTDDTISILIRLLGIQYFKSCKTSREIINIVNTLEDNLKNQFNLIKTNLITFENSIKQKDFNWQSKMIQRAHIEKVLADYTHKYNKCQKFDDFGELKSKGLQLLRRIPDEKDILYKQGQTDIAGLLSKRLVDHYDNKNSHVNALAISKHIKVFSPAQQEYYLSLQKQAADTVQKQWNCIFEPRLNTKLYRYKKIFFEKENNLTPTSIQTPNDHSAMLTLLQYAHDKERSLSYKFCNCFDFLFHGQVNIDNRIMTVIHAIVAEYLNLNELEKLKFPNFISYLGQQQKRFLDPARQKELGNNHQDTQAILSKIKEMNSQLFTILKPLTSNHTYIDESISSTASTSSLGSSRSEEGGLIEHPFTPEDQNDNNNDEDNQHSPSSSYNILH